MIWRLNVFLPGLQAFTMALALDLRPGTGLDAFNLGMPVWEALAYVDQYSSIFQVVHIKYNEEEPLSLDLVLSFPEFGFHLWFEPRSQRLRLIEVHDVQLMQMRYATSTIGGPHAAATFVAVYALFGPTFPGTFNVKRCLYYLNYPGLSFVFPIPPQYINYWRHRTAEQPLEFPDGTTPVMSRVCIYDCTGDGCGNFKLILAPQLPGGGLYMEEVHAKLGEDIHFIGNGQRLAFGASPQVEKTNGMSGHNLADPAAYSKSRSSSSDSFMRRLLLQLFPTRPGHFVRWAGIQFCHLLGRLYTTTRTVEKGAEEISLDSDTNRCISSVSKWSEVQAILGDGGRAAIQAQGSDTNPFGPTFVYGYRDIALEVMKNGHIDTVTLFQTENAGHSSTGPSSQLMIP